MIKLSIKLLILGLSATALISVFVVSHLSLRLSNTVTDGQIKLKESASLMAAESSLGKLVNNVLESTISSSSSQSLEMLSQSQPVKNAQQQFDKIFSQLKKGLHEDQKKQLNQLKQDFDQLLTSEDNVRKKTASILNNQLQIKTLANQIDQLSEELLKTSSSLVGKISLSGKRVKRKLKKLVNNNQLKSNPTKINELIDVTTGLVKGSQDKLSTASNRLMVAVAKLSSIAQKLITAPTESSIIDLELNQGLQLIQNIDKYLATIAQLSSDDSAFVSIQKTLQSKKDELVHLLFGDKNSIKILRTFGIAEQVKREQALKQMVIVVSSLSKTLIQVSAKAQQAQSKVVTDTEDSISTLSALNSIVFIVVFIVLISASIIVIRMITKPLADITKAMAEISSGDGDLTKRIEVKGVEEVIELSKYFNHFVEKIQALIRSVSESSIEMSATVTKSKEITINSKQNIMLQQASTQQLATVMEELANSFSEVSDSASQASKHSEDCTSEANQGHNVVKRSVASVEELSSKIESGVSAMERLSSTSQSVASVLDVIKGIADQTNLLALNAAIEAARAGEQGRGFAVVADEVRALASKTQISTGQISEIIENLKLDADEASNVMTEGKVLAKESVTQSLAVNLVLDNIMKRVKGIADLNYQIASSANEQSNAVSEAAQNVEEINDISTKNTDASNALGESSESLYNLSKKLQDALGQFKI